ncbi:transcriptional regulator [Archaeoglobales archaeon]|nr:MAG: transcriptional regulator [Archaeoglobales archaeon]
MELKKLNVERKYNLLKRLSKKSNLKVLLSLKDNPKKWSDLEKSLYKKDLYHSIRELLNLGLIQITVIHDTPTGSKAYELTPLGKKIVRHIEEMEKEFEKYHKGLPKEPDKFINELLDKD